MGVRQPDVYGASSLSDLQALLEKRLGGHTAQVCLEFAQHNSEGDMITCLEQAWAAKVGGVILNAGAFTHTSLALADCLAWINLPVVEVHLSNILARDEKRHVSLIAPYCIGLVAGFGLYSYALALDALLARLGAGN